MSVRTTLVQTICLTMMPFTLLDFDLVEALATAVILVDDRLRLVRVNAAAQSGNTAVCLVPESFVYSDGAGSWTAWFRQKRRHLSAGAYYRPFHQLLLGGLATSHILHYFLIIPLQFTDFGTICVAFYALRIASAIIIYSKILRQFHDERLLFWFPLLDALLAFYSSVFVPLVFFRFNYLISWK